MTRTRRLAAAYIALAAAVAVLFALNLFWGSVSLAPGAVLTALLGKGGDALAGNIILQLRLPRAVMAALLGACAGESAGKCVPAAREAAEEEERMDLLVTLDQNYLGPLRVLLPGGFSAKGKPSR